ncbi:MAG: 30S ribosomal protein S20 [Candidatus Schekmanbacteria bacterium]|nr:30S ribosomal protein S20 [Candidatus Schekmanbacteria bacterium]
MANHKAALKSLRQDEKRHERNKMVKTQVKTVAKKVLNAVEAKNLDEAKSALHTAIRTIDKACSKGVIHKNNAARKKSRLSVRVNSIATA